MYPSPGHYSTAFLLLSSVSSIFLICGDLNIHVEVSLKESAKFANFIESGNITHVKVGEFISKHVLIK